MTKRLNNIVVKPIPIPKVNPKSTLRYDLFPEPYSNIFICAKKKSRKTCLINTILNHCINKDTAVYIFCSTVFKDASYKHIIRTLRKKGNIVYVFTEIQPLADILRLLGDEVNMDIFDSSSEEEEEESLSEQCFGKDKKENKKFVKQKNNSKISPEHVFIFDDLGEQLQSPTLAILMRTNYHYKSKVIISGHYPNDLSVPARKQVDYWLLFAKHSNDKLTTIYTNADLNLPLDEFLKAYRTATQDKYNFLYIDAVNSELRKNFDEEILTFV